MTQAEAIERVKQIHKRAVNNAKRPRTTKEYREEYRLDAKALKLVITFAGTNIGANLK